jgi:hypothetical protein
VETPKYDNMTGSSGAHARMTWGKMMSSGSKTAEILTFGFIEEGSKVLLEVTNKSDETLNCVEILTVFLKDEDTPGGGPSRVHISFQTLSSIRPKAKSIMSHKTWIDGQPANAENDQLKRLKELAGEDRPYVLDVSWEDAQGKKRFQRTPVGH